MEHAGSARHRWRTVATLNPVGHDVRVAGASYEIIYLAEAHDADNRTALLDTALSALLIARKLSDLSARGSVEDSSGGARFNLEIRCREERAGLNS